jgi:hypothetical protein
MFKIYVYYASTGNRTQDLQFTRLTLYQLSYRSLSCSKEHFVFAATADRTRDLEIFSLTLSQLSYSGVKILNLKGNDRN